MGQPAASVKIGINGGKTAPGSVPGIPATQLALASSLLQQLASKAIAMHWQHLVTYCPIRASAVPVCVRQPSIAMLPFMTKLKDRWVLQPCDGLAAWTRTGNPLHVHEAESARPACLLDNRGMPGIPRDL